MSVRPLRYYCQLRHPTSSAHWIGHRTVQISIWLIIHFGAFCRTSLSLPDPWRRPSERTTDWRVASFWSEHYWQSSSGVTMGGNEMEAVAFGRPSKRSAAWRRVLTEMFCRKIIKIVATRCQILKAKMHQIRFRLRLCPRPRWGSLQRSPDPTAAFKAHTYF